MSKPRTLCRHDASLCGTTKRVALLKETTSKCAPTQLQPPHWRAQERRSATSPSLFWTYKDEDFGGTCARLELKRGGHLNAQSACAAPFELQDLQRTELFFKKKKNFDLHRRCSGVVTRLFGNTPLTALASKFLSSATATTKLRTTPNLHPSLPPPWCAPHPKQLHWHGGTHSFVISGQTCIR